MASAIAASVNNVTWVLFVARVVCIMSASVVIKQRESRFPISRWLRVEVQEAGLAGQKLLHSLQICATLATSALSEIKIVGAARS